MSWKTVPQRVTSEVTKVDSGCKLLITTPIVHGYIICITYAYVGRPVQAHIFVMENGYIVIQITTLASKQESVTVANFHLFIVYKMR